MNEITIQGNLTAAPVLRYGQNGRAFCAFAIAINRSYYNRDRDARVDQPTVFLDVIAFNNLAENAAKSMTKGTTVTVTGYLGDNSYTPEGSDQRIRRTRLEAGDIAVSLRFATAAVTKRSTERPIDSEPTEPTEPARPAESAQEPGKSGRSAKAAARVAASA